MVNGHLSIPTEIRQRWLSDPMRSILFYIWHLFVQNLVGLVGETCLFAVCGCFHDVVDPEILIGVCACPILTRSLRPAVLLPTRRHLPLLQMLRMWTLQCRQLHQLR